MTLGINIYNEVRRVGAALLAAVGGVGTAVSGVDTAVGQVSAKVTTAQGAVATLQGTANEIATAVAALQGSVGALGAVKSVQRGRIDMGVGMTTPVTIAAVNPAKSIVNVSAAGAYQSANTLFVGGQIVNATTIEVVCSAGGGGYPAFWQVVEFY